jgi:hypothetical protein
MTTARLIYITRWGTFQTAAVIVAFSLRSRRAADAQALLPHFTY